MSGSCTFGEAVKRIAEWEHHITFFSSEQVDTQGGGSVLPGPDEEWRKNKESTCRKREVVDYRRAQSKRHKALHQFQVQQRLQDITLKRNEADKPGKEGQRQDKRLSKRRRSD